MLFITEIIELNSEFVKKTWTAVILKGWKAETWSSYFCYLILMSLCATNPFSALCKHIMHKKVNNKYVFLEMTRNKPVKDFWNNLSIVIPAWYTMRRTYILASLINIFIDFSSAKQCDSYYISKHLTFS